VKKISGDYGRIDLFWPGILLVEHKSFGEDLRKAETQAFQYIRDLANDPARRDEIPRTFKNANPNRDGETHKFQGLNFQNGNVLGRMRSRSDGRCLFKKETFASDGCHSVERQQRHRIEVGIHFPGAWNQRLAAAPAVARQTRFRIPEATRHGFCRWLLLARLPVALPDASRQSAILAGKDFTKRRQRSHDKSAAAPDWLAGGSTLGAHIEGFGFGCA
jgi:hypothetical protein